MSAKAILVLCAQALFMQSALGQCLGGAYGLGSAYGLGGAYGLGSAYGFDGIYGLGAGYGLDGAYGLGAGYGFGGAYGLGGAYGFGGAYGLAGPGIDISPTSGGGLPVASASAIAPVGLSVASENVYEGILAAAGELPFVGTVGVEGVLPTAGVGAVNHACGDGINAMVSDGVGYAGAYGLGLGARGFGYRGGFGGCGCGL